MPTVKLNVKIHEFIFIEQQQQTLTDHPVEDKKSIHYFESCFEMTDILIAFLAQTIHHGNSLV